MRAVADVQPAFDVDPVPHDLVHFGEQRLGIEDDTVPDGAAHAGVQYAARHLVEHERLGADVHRMPGVRAALVAHHPIGTLGQDVDELALALIAPLGADYDNGPRLCIEHGVGG